MRPAQGGGEKREHLLNNTFANKSMSAMPKMGTIKPSKKVINFMKKYGK